MRGPAGDDRAAVPMRIGHLPSNASCAYWGRIHDAGGWTGNKQAAMTGMGHGARMKTGWLRRPAVVAVLLASALYVWQVASLWTEQSNNTAQYDAIRGPDTARLYGRGIAAGAIGMLSFDLRGLRAVMQLQDMPALPPNLVYQMWFVVDDGTIVQSSVFRITVDSQDFATVNLSSPRLLGNYRQYRVTIEPAGGSLFPTGPVVMEN